jgi:hypothetical protein
MAQRSPWWEAPPPRVLTGAQPSAHPRGIHISLVGVAQLVEHLFCKQAVRGSSPLASSKFGPVKRTTPHRTLCTTDSIRTKPRNVFTKFGGLPEWPKGAGCKPAGASLRWFESITLHPGNSGGQDAKEFDRAAPAARAPRGSSSVGRASAFQAERRGFESLLPLRRLAHLAQLAEHVLGKDEVTSSSLVVGSRRTTRLNERT